MKKKGFWLVATMVVATITDMGMMMVSCSNNDSEIVNPEDNDLKSITLTRSERELVTANNDFAFKLFKRAKVGGPAGPCDAPPKNMILSPISITYALGMLNNGATGETQQQINETLGFGDIGADGINAFCRKMLSEAPALDKLTKVMIANTIYMNKDYKLKPMFVELAKQYYDAEPETRDFADGKTCKVINKWANDHTEGMIPEVLSEDEFDPTYVSYLLNAIFFKGVWANKFDKAQTKDEKFRGEDGTETKVPMMHLEKTFNYMKTDLFEMLSLPYGNGAYVMNILLPNESNTVLDVLNELIAGKWQQYQYGGLSAIVDVKLPRFESKTDIDLVPVMSDLGMPKAFTGDAEFPNFCNVPTMIGLMKQVARIKLDEEGTEAAAVTVIGVKETAFIPEEPQRVNFHATRPFLYMISEQSTGAIFFIGQYVG